MAGLEQRVSEPVAAPALIAAVVSAMPSDTVAAPRNLSPSLRSRLDDGGSVPLHPASSLSGCTMFTRTSARTHGLSARPSRSWRLRNGRASTTLVAVSKEEMEAVTELTDRSQEEQGASDGPILSWSEDEELLSDLLSVLKRGATFSVLPCLAIVVALVASASEDVRGKSSETSGKPRTKPPVVWRGGRVH